MIDPIEIFQKIFAYYGIIIVVFGTILNILNFIVCYTFRNNPTFIFLKYLCITNIFTIYHWNADYIMRYLFNIDWLNYSLFVCKFFNFIQYSASQSSAWILVLISTEQLMSIKIKLWRNSYFRTNKAYITVSLLVFIICIVNSNIFIFLGHQELINETLVDFCFNGNITDYAANYGLFHLVSYSLLPFAIILISNTLLIINLKNSKKKVFQINLEDSCASSGVIKNKKILTKQNSMNKIIIFTTLTFILMTLPNAVVSFLYSQLSLFELGLLVIRIGDLSSFTFHAFNFFINFFFNKRFNAKFKAYFMCFKTLKKKKQVSFFLSNK